MNFDNTSLYTYDAIKQIHPGITVKKCKKIFEEFQLLEKGILNYKIFRERYQQFGLYTGTLNAQPHLLHNLFPAKFAYLKDIKNYPFEHGSNGKGITYEQCEASLLMEFFERVSIRFKNFELQYNSKNGKKGKEQFKVMVFNEYLNFLNGNQRQLFKHFCDEKLKDHIFNISEDEISLVKMTEIKNSTQVLFPIDVLLMGSNGYTSGNTDKESIIGGIFEIIERYTQTLFAYDNIQARIVDANSLTRAYPELSPIIHKCLAYFDLFRVIDISIVINNVKFYSFVITSTKNIFGYKDFFAGGAHLSQRIALIRALSESIQHFGHFSNRHLGVADRFFGVHFIDTLLKRVENLEETPINKEERNYRNIDEIYRQCQAVFDSILVLYCTNKHFKIPVHIIYIPELFPQSYYWSDHFNLSNFKINDLIIGQNLEGLKELFFRVDEIYDKEIERHMLYCFLLLKLSDKELLDYYLHNKNNRNLKPLQKLSVRDVFNNTLIKRWRYAWLIRDFEKNQKLVEDLMTGQGEIGNSTELREATARLTGPQVLSPQDAVDPDSFVFFNRVLRKENKDKEDYQYLFDTYVRIGCLDYGVHYLRKNNIEPPGMKEFYIDQYRTLVERVERRGLLERSASIKDRLARIY